MIFFHPLELPLGIVELQSMLISVHVPDQDSAAMSILAPFHGAKASFVISQGWFVKETQAIVVLSRKRTRV